MAGEDKVEHAGREPVDDVREVAEQDAQVGSAVDDALRSRQPSAVGTRVDADDLDGAAAELDRPRVVREKRGRLELVQLGRTGERVARRGEVMVPEHRVAARHPRQERAQALFARGPREQVAADQRQVGLPLLDPVGSALDRHR